MSTAASVVAGPFTRTEKRELAALYGAAVISNLAYTVLIPFVPFLTSRHDLTPVELAGVFAGFAVTKAAFQPLGGVLVDRLGARHVAVAGLAGGALCTAGIAFARDAGELVLLRLLWGAAEGLAIPAQFRLCFGVCVGSTTKQGKVIGWYGAAEVAGMALGPALAGALQAWAGFATTVLCAAVATAMGAAVLSLAPPGSSTPAADPHDDEVRARVSLDPLRSATSVILFAGVIDFASNLVYAALEPALPLYIGSRFVNADSVANISLAFLLGLLAFSAISLQAGSILSRLGLFNGLALAAAIAAAGFVVQWLASDIGVLIAGFVVFMVSQGLIYVATRTAMAAIPERRQGRAFGYFGLIQELGWVIGPFVGVRLLQCGGSCLLLAFVAIHIVMLVAALTLTAASQRSVGCEHRKG